MSDVVIRYKRTGKQISLPIINKKTVLTGEGATGKTYFINELTSGELNNKFELLYNNKPAYYIYMTSDLDMSDPTRILIADEEVVNKRPNINKAIKRLPNPLLVICRNIKIAGDTDIRSVYSLSFDGDNLGIAPYCNSKIISLPTGVYTHMICESSERKSEHLILNDLLGLDCIAAGGNNKVYESILNLYKTYGNSMRALVVADVSAFSGPAISLTNMIPNSRYEIYDYPCFEALLLYSKLVMSLGENIKRYDFSYTSLEVFFEKELERITKGTKLEYKHRPSKVSECFYTECKECSDYIDTYLFRTNFKDKENCDYSDPNTVGKVLFNKYGIGLMAWYYANYTQFLETYDYLIEDKNKSPEEQALSILNSIKDIYLGDLRYKCFDD